MAEPLFMNNISIRLSRSLTFKPETDFKMTFNIDYGGMAPRDKPITFRVTTEPARYAVAFGCDNFVAGVEKRTIGVIDPGTTANVTMSIPGNAVIEDGDAVEIHFQELDPSVPITNEMIKYRWQGNWTGRTIPFTRRKFQINVQVPKPSLLETEATKPTVVKRKEKVGKSTEQEESQPVPEEEGKECDWNFWLRILGLCFLIVVAALLYNWWDAISAPFSENKNQVSKTY